MKNIIRIVLLILSIPQQGFSQINFSFPPEIKILDKQSYTGSTLYGHINGGAELFLEYGFNHLDYCLLSDGKNEYTVEIYQMTDPFSAYGIFSIKKFNCLELSLYECRTRFQYSVQRSEYYITIANDIGSDDAMKRSLEIAEVLLKNNPPVCLNIPQFTELFHFEAGSYPSLLMGKSGFQNYQPEWEDFFAGFEDYSCYYQQGTANGQKVEFFRVEFKSQDEANRFMSEKGWKTSIGFINPEKNWYIIHEGQVIIFACGNIQLL